MEKRPVYSLKVLCNLKVVQKSYKTLETILLFCRKTINQCNTKDIIVLYFLCYNTLLLLYCIITRTNVIHQTKTLNVYISSCDPLDRTARNRLFTWLVKKRQS